jgi:hypothetical protein
MKITEVMKNQEGVEIEVIVEVHQLKRQGFKVALLPEIATYQEQQFNI